MIKKLIFLILLLGLISLGAYYYYLSGREHTQATTYLAPVPSGVGATFVLSAISDTPVKKTAEYQKFADYLQAKLGNVGISNVKIVIARSPAEMVILLKQNKADMYTEDPFESSIVNKYSNAEMLLAKYKADTIKLHSILVVAKGSKIKSIDQLKGKMIAFTSDDSEAGFYLPKAELVAAGYNLTKKDSYSSPVSSSEIGYYFANTEEDVLKDIYKGRAMGGAMEQSEFDKVSVDYPGTFSTIFTTFDVYKDVVSVRRSLAPNIKNRLKEVLLAMKDTEEGRAILLTINKANYYDISKDPATIQKIQKEAASLENDIFPKYP